MMMMFLDDRLEMHYLLHYATQMQLLWRNMLK